MRRPDSQSQFISKVFSQVEAIPILVPQSWEPENLSKMVSYAEALRVLSTGTKGPRSTKYGPKQPHTIIPPSNKQLTNAVRQEVFFWELPNPGLSIGLSDRCVNKCPLL